MSAKNLIARARRWQGLVSLGVMEQVLLSGSSFVFTAVQAHLLGPVRFGEFSIVWAIVTLLETSMWGIFGDALPETAHRLPRTLWPQLRVSLVVLSLMATAGLSVLLLLASGAVAIRAPEIAITMVAAVPTIFTARVQNAFRRLYYLDNLRVPTASGAVAYALTLAAGAGLLIAVRCTVPLYGMLCLAGASAASCIVFAVLRPALAWPDFRLLSWTMRRLWQTGRWMIIQSVLSWAGNMGVIPLAGVISSVAMSGTLRAVQTLTTPMSQLNSVLLSIIVPNAAKKLRERRASDPVRIAVQTAALLGSFAMIYSLAVTSAGHWLYHLLFGATAAGMTRWVVGAATLGYSIESVRFGVIAVLLGLGRTKILSISQTCALVFLVISLPLAAHFGVLGIVIAMTCANNLGTLIVSVYFAKFVVPSVDKTRPAMGYRGVAMDKTI